MADFGDFLQNPEVFWENPQNGLAGGFLDGGPDYQVDVVPGDGREGVGGAGGLQAGLTGQVP